MTTIVYNRMFRAKAAASPTPEPSATKVAQQLLVEGTQRALAARRAEMERAGLWAPIISEEERAANVERKRQEWRAKEAELIKSEQTKTDEDALLDENDLEGIVYAYTLKILPGYAKIGHSTRADWRQRIREQKNAGMPGKPHIRFACKVDDAAALRRRFTVHWRTIDWTAPRNGLR